MEIEALLVEAEALDAAQDMKYGKGNRGDELPEDLRFKAARLENIKRYKKELEERVRQEAIDSGKLDKDGNPPPSKGSGRAPKNPPGTPKPKDQINSLKALTFRAVPVAAGVVRDTHIAAAVVTYVDVPTEGFCATKLDVFHGLALFSGE